MPRVGCVREDFFLGGEGYEIFNSQLIQIHLIYKNIYISIFSQKNRIAYIWAWTDRQLF